MLNHKTKSKKTPAFVLIIEKKNKPIPHEKLQMVRLYKFEARVTTRHKLESVYTQIIHRVPIKDNNFTKSPNINANLFF